MTRTIIGPGKYVQGSGELQRIKEHIKALGKNFLVIASRNGVGSLCSIKYLATTNSDYYISIIIFCYFSKSIPKVLRGH